MKRMWKLCVVGVFLLFVACGKNDPVAPIGTTPYAPYPAGPMPQAPVPPNGGYQMPPGGSMGGSGYPPPYFQPQLPPNYPPQYIPWLPMQNYFGQTPQLQQWWGNQWSNWQSFCGANGYSQWDFPTFWYVYVPQAWTSVQLQQVYQFYNSNVYFWVQPNMQIDCSGGADYFWQYYQGLSFSTLDSCFGF